MCEIILLLSMLILTEGYSFDRNNLFVSRTITTQDAIPMQDPREINAPMYMKNQSDLWKNRFRLPNIKINVQNQNWNAPPPIRKREFLKGDKCPAGYGRAYNGVCRKVW